MPEVRTRAFSVKRDLLRELKRPTTICLPEVRTRAFSVKRDLLRELKRPTTICLPEVPSGTRVSSVKRDLKRP